MRMKFKMGNLILKNDTKSVTFYEKIRKTSYKYKKSPQKNL